MFEFSPCDCCRSKKSVNIFCSRGFIFCALVLSALILIPATSSALVYNSALIQEMVDDQHLLAVSDARHWEVGEIVPVLSQNAKIGVFAFAEVLWVRPKKNRYDVYMKLVRQSRRYMIQKGDYIKRIDLTSENPDYVGSTDLLIRKSEQDISSKYRPLVYQGVFIGETAQTLYQNEFLVNIVGNLYYGVTDWLSLSTFTTFNVLGRPNASAKIRFYDTEATTLSIGASFVRLEKEDQASLNLNLYWDSTSSDALISHVFLGLGLIQYDGAAEASALKALGSSSFQTGYEVVLDNWDRFLIGPSYNFEKKALGGYLSYIWIWDRFHAQVSLNATNVTQLKVDTQDGYFGNFDLFWRF